MGSFSKRAAVIGVVLVLGITGAVAWAVWTARGTGAATGKAGVALRIQTIASTGTGKLLYPGGSGDLKIRVSNDNTFPVRVNTVVPKTPITADPDHNAMGCTVGATGVSVDEFITVSWTPIPAGQNVEFTMPNVVHMDNTSNDKCQGARFSVPVVLVAASA
jgi:hypothetical protein